MHLKKFDEKKVNFARIREIESMYEKKSLENNRR